MPSNTLEFNKRPDGAIVATVRSGAERDISAVVDDPASTIVTLGMLAGLQVTVQARHAPEGQPPPTEPAA